MDPQDNCVNSACHSHDLESSHCCLKHQHFTSYLKSCPGYKPAGSTLEHRHCAAFTCPSNSGGSCALFSTPAELGCSRYMPPDTKDPLPKEDRMKLDAKLHRVGQRREDRHCTQDSSPATKPDLADMMQDFHLALQELARVTTFGCAKHGELGGWRRVPDFHRIYQNKKARHAIDALVCTQDSESGLHPLAHEAWNALALLQDHLEIRAGRPVPGPADGTGDPTNSPS